MSPGAAVNDIYNFEVFATPDNIFLYSILCAILGTNPWTILGTTHNAIPKQIPSAFLTIVLCTL